MQRLTNTIAAIETNTSQCFSILLDGNTFALSKNDNRKFRRCFEMVNEFYYGGFFLDFGS